VVGVIIIGGIAMAVIVGASFGKARTKARTASCMSNVKQLALGHLMFAQDHQQTFPNSATWKDEVMPYIKNRQILVCPGSNRGEGSYEMNPQLSNMKLERILRPAETPLIYDAGFPHGDPPHPDGWVVAFADGHAKRIPPSEAAAYR
jgi:prepilin-type processing-associated H-X9-DG protein